MLLNFDAQSHVIILFVLLIFFSKVCINNLVILKHKAITNFLLKTDFCFCFFWLTIHPAPTKHWYKFLSWSKCAAATEKHNAITPVLFPLRKQRISSHTVHSTHYLFSKYCTSVFNFCQSSKTESFYWCVYIYFICCIFCSYTFHLLFIMCLNLSFFNECLYSLVVLLN